MTPEECIAAFGPLTSKWGLTSWQLLLGCKEIVAWPYKWTEAFRLGLFLETGFGRDAGLVFSMKNPHQFTSALAGRELRTYTVSAIESITLTCASVGNRIEILRADGTCDRYGIMYRWQTDEYRKTLHSLYGNRFLECGFPRTFWEKLLKY